MTERVLPVKIDPFKLAATKTTLQGRMPLAQLLRLSELLLTNAGEVQVALEFGREAFGGPYYIKGSIKGNLALPCQRCGEPLRYDINVKPKLSPVLTDAEAAQLSEEYEAWVTQGELVRTVDIIEEELLLSLPMMVKHSPEVCSVTFMHDS